MISCGEPANGYAEYICPNCFEKKKVGFTCKCRFCTSCGKRYVDEWVEKTERQKDRKTVKSIFDVAHRHLVFTIPEELRKIIFSDRMLIRIMMDCASKAAVEVLQSKGVDAVPGILSVVHTFGRDLKFNPHVHMLMTEGGLTSSDQRIYIPFLPYGPLRKKWRYYLLVTTQPNAKLLDRSNGLRLFCCYEFQYPRRERNPYGLCGR